MIDLTFDTAVLFYYSILKKPISGYSKLFPNKNINLLVKWLAYIGSLQDVLKIVPGMEEDHARQVFSAVAELILYV